MSSENWPAQFNLNELPTQTLKASTEEMIRHSLLNGDMKPGEIYSANALAKQLRISNSPVREAMMSLAHRGLLELVRNRGFRVIDMSDKDRHEVYALRELIEVEAIRQIAHKGITPGQAHKLHELAVETLTTLTSSTGDTLHPYLDSDDRFHAYTISLLDNRRLAEIISNLRDQSRINDVYKYLPERGLLMPSAQEHIEMATAIASQDANRAAEIMHNHLQYARPTDRETISRSVPTAT